MDIEFIVQDIYSLTRPQWKLASNLEEASRSFQLAVAQDQKNSSLNKPAEPDEPESSESSDDDGERLPEPDVDADEESSDSGEVDVCLLFIKLFILLTISIGYNQQRCVSFGSRV
jgi:regulator of nonsense transcripts 2